MNPHIVVIAKNPIIGKVKTRLAKAIGNAKTLEVYQALLTHTETILKQSGIPYTIHFDDKQKGKTLGEKLVNAFIKFNKTNSPIIFIGSDFPFLNTELLNSTKAKLKTNDYVIGPTLDGGYYLIGLKKQPEKVFTNISWSTNLVLKETLKIIKESKYSLLPTYYDIDTIDELNKFIQENNTFELAKKLSNIL
jgi:uncharacterized protein